MRRGCKVCHMNPGKSPCTTGVQPVTHPLHIANPNLAARETHLRRFFLADEGECQLCFARIQPSAAIPKSSGRQYEGQRRSDDCRSLNRDGPSYSFDKADRRRKPRLPCTLAVNEILL